MFDPIDLSNLRRHSLQSRSSIVRSDLLAKPLRPHGSLSEWLNTLPSILKVNEFNTLVNAWVTAIERDKPVILGFGAHLIKVGLGPLLCQLLKRRYVHCVATNGAGAIHDVELALAGHTSEDVQSGLDSGDFGMAAETGDFFSSAADVTRGLGFGVGSELLNKGVDSNLSVFAAARSQDLTATVHVSWGADIIHPHPSVDAGDMANSSHVDFKRLITAVSELHHGGVYINIGSAVLMPEVFLKALSSARNIVGTIQDFTTANMDMIPHYRPRVNVLQRPVAGGTGQSVELIGHHEIMLPLLIQAVIDKIEG